MKFSQFISKEIDSINIPDFSIRIIDGGARSGGEPERWESIKKKSRIYSFDPDEQECEGLMEQYSKKEYNIKAIPVCLGGWSEEEREFHITEMPSSSSFSQLDMGFVERIKTYNLVVGPVPQASLGLRPGRTVLTKSRSLDDLLREGSIEQPDFIKLDVQGAEMEVLLGGGECLKQTMGLEVEVWFEKVYKSQALFSEIDIYLRSQGFSFYNFNFTHTGHYAGRNASSTTFIHQQSLNGLPKQMSGQLLTSDAIYLRDPIRTTQKVVTKKEQCDLLKLAVIAEAVHQVEYAFELLAYGRAYAEVVKDHVFAALCQKIYSRAEKRYLEENGGRNVFEA